MSLCMSAWVFIVNHLSSTPIVRITINLTSLSPTKATTTTTIQRNDDEYEEEKTFVENPSSLMTAPPFSMQLELHLIIIDKLYHKTDIYEHWRSDYRQKPFSNPIVFSSRFYILIFSILFSRVCGCVCAIEMHLNNISKQFLPSCASKILYPFRLNSEPFLKHELRNPEIPNRWEKQSIFSTKP